MKLPITIIFSAVRNHAKHIVHTWGKLDSLGYNAENVADGGLNSPYDAKAVGDYTGLTPPF
jgi:hypothetical protein